MNESRLLRDKPDTHSDAPEIPDRTSRGEQPQRPAPPGDAPDQASKRAPEPGEGGGEGEGGKRDAAAGKRKQKRSKLPMIVLGLFVVIAIGAGTYYWYTTRDLQSTDDAFTDGHAITVSPRVAGQVTVLAVNDNQFVHRGDLLIQIDPRDYQAARDQAAGQLEVAKAQLANAVEALSKAKVQYPAQLQSAQAAVESAEANEVNAQSDYRRQHNIDRAATTQQSVDQATAGLRQAQAQVDQAKAQLLQAQLVTQNIAQAEAQVKQLEGQVQEVQAQLDRAELNLSYTRVVAPQDGWVTKRNVEQGNYVEAGGSILSLVAPQFWVTANFKETQLARMRPGQHVSITVDAYPSLKLEGHVDSVQMGSGSKFTAFPAENATGNYVKIVQRVPVKIDIDSGLDPNMPLPLGISVEPTVELK
jgi:membrane fusion protein (multidrug efflux system)